MSLPTGSEPQVVVYQDNVPAQDEIIHLENVSVQYRVPEERIGTFKEYAIRLLQRRIRYKSFWALDQVNLSIRRGEVFGVIGRNGAGKSTLLKVISRVLRPTKGRIIVYGKIAPLLELGAGFHPELSGRENVYLNGALLGYSQKEMEECFDQIVEFAGLRPFIDASIRTYSSGMYTRLGFAVATAHVPDILLVDEILSVGDIEFQQKCFARIDEFRNQGSTIVLVTHALEQVEKICQRACWIDHGKVEYQGEPKKVITAYTGS
jgi:homopolymeric O-antigen transport system ATP-binding protein